MQSQQCQPSFCPLQCCTITNQCAPSLSQCHLYPQKIKVSAASGDTLYTVMIIFSIAMLIAAIFMRIRRYRRIRQLQAQRDAYIRQGQVNQNYQAVPPVNPNYQNWNNNNNANNYNPPAAIPNNQVYVEQQPGYYNLNRPQNNPNNNQNPYV